ncbi:MAG: aminotransferase class I/II-fold pyridoxal phosphate-dependent enzyme [Acidaminococcaceae bacterium]
MYYFTSDYTEGCHPLLGERLMATNLEQTNGYGDDPYSHQARQLIKKACGRDEVAVHFCIGGTQTNLTVICAALRPFQGVFATVPAHINTHEAGAIERTGHKVLALPSTDGKLTAEQVAAAYLSYAHDPNREHWVQPKMVYLSQPTEIGTMYSKAELTALATVCRQYELYLFVDGARLGYALAADTNDLSLADLANLCDVFYIGGTKCGALFGEAVVISNPALRSDFFTIMKQGGAVLAKGRLLGLQFQTLFTDNLYHKICRHGIDMAMLVRDAIAAKGLPVVTVSPTNQQFPIFPAQMLAELSKNFVFAPWETYGEDALAVRICTSWATEEKQVHAFIKALQAY